MLIRVYERPALRTGGRIKAGDLLRICVFRCDLCEKEFEKRQTQTNSTYNFCSKDCLHEARKPGGLVNRAVKNACTQKYGVENAFQSDVIREKIKQVYLEKYGVDHPMRTDDNRLRQSEKNRIRWKDMSSTERLRISQKTKSTCLTRYGVDAPMKDPEIRRKATQTMLDGGFLRSRGEKFLQALLEKAFVSSSISVQVWKNNVAGRSHPADLRVDSLGILIEYDGNYWHSRCAARDQEFNDWCVLNGQKLLRISEEDLCLLFETGTKRLPRSIKKLENLMIQKNINKVRRIVECASEAQETVIFCQKLLLEHNCTTDNACFSE